MEIEGKRPYFGIPEGQGHGSASAISYFGCEEGGVWVVLRFCQLVDDGISKVAEIGSYNLPAINTNDEVIPGFNCYIWVFVS